MADNLQVVPQDRQDAGTAGVVPAGATVRVHAGDVLASPASTAQFTEQAYAVLAAGCGLGVRVGGLRGNRHADILLRRCCESLRVACHEAQASPRSIALTLAAAATGPAKALVTRRAALGAGPVYLLAEAAELQASREDGTEVFLQRLWRVSESGPAVAACAPLVTAASPLLNDELADAVEPGFALQVPAGSAWTVVPLALDDFVVAGTLDSDCLLAALQAAVAAGESAHDELDWPTPAARLDSWRNRRLAVLLTGVGDLVAALGQDPASHDCLLFMDRLLTTIREALWNSSHRFAQSAAMLPSLADSDPLRGVRCDRARQRWQKHWQQALDTQAIRHRNLLAMSPAALLPTAGRHRDAYLNLLPLLAFADVCSFAGLGQAGRWKAKEFIALYRQMGAVLERRNARRLIAKPV